MAVSDGMIMLILLCALTYQFLWKQGWVRRIIGDLFFIFIGIASHYVISVTDYPWGFIISIIAVIDLVYTLLKA